jgi:hypothetical protein
VAVEVIVRLPALVYVPFGIHIAAGSEYLVRA